MLEVKNLTKIYKSKKAEDVRALDDVSLSFGETGMVFLLGKSGSGKSTLLNVMGGLDKFDSGEIIIKGKSSKTFKESDFDSYRNTYLGFIFQEYNILNEFTVYKNIELALELQGKKADKNTVNDLLEQVDLKGYGKRKPNELSGGQKQRIAIARALIKNPEIIMADEPTGALDSNTGKQVFDTLKKLSETKLVIVVSHDREFAEIYADRIIELKDGKVLSDNVKRSKAPESSFDGFSVVNKNIIHIEKGHKFTKDDAEHLSKFLKDADCDIIISSSDKINKDIKKVAKIRDDGQSEYFDETKPEDVNTKSYDENKLKLIKSKLKFKDSFKIGASGLKTKKIRLFITILLSAISLTLFGVADTMASFNVKKSNYDTLSKLGVETIDIVSSHGANNYGDNIDTSIELVSEKQYQDLKNEFPDYNFIPVYQHVDSISSTTKEFIDNTTYYLQNTNGSVYLTEEEFNSAGFKFVNSTVNQHAPINMNEIVISYAQYEVYLKYGMQGVESEITNPSDVIGKTIKLNDINYTIVGIIDDELDKTEFGRLQELSQSNNMSLDFYNLYQKYNFKITNGLYGVIYFNKDSLEYRNTKNTNVQYYQFASKISDDSNHTYYNIATNLESSSFYYFDINKTSLQENEVLIGISYSFNLNSKYDDFYIEKSSNWQWVEGEDILIDYYRFKDYQYDTLDELRLGIQNYYLENYSEYSDGLPIKFYNNNNQEIYDSLNYKVVGVYYDENGYYDDSRAVIFKDIENTPSQIQFKFGKYKKIFANLSRNSSIDKNLIISLSDYGKLGDKLIISSEVSSLYLNFLNTIKLISKIFLYIGIGFAVFSALMLMNFIAISISYKKKEIGILRALGARRSDVYGIFFNESLIITFINYVVSIALTITAVILVNTLMFKDLGISITLLSFGIRQIVLMLVISILIAAIASFLPTNKVSKMKPIDAILDRKQ